MKVFDPIPSKQMTESQSMASSGLTLWEGWIFKKELGLIGVL